MEGGGRKTTQKKNDKKNNNMTTTRLSVDHSNSSTQFQMLLSVDSLQIYRRMFGRRDTRLTAASLSSDVDCGGSAVATLANESVGGDEEDVHEDFVSYVHRI